MSGQKHSYRTEKKELTEVPPAKKRRRKHTPPVDIEEISDLQAKVLYELWRLEEEMDQQKIPIRERRLTVEEIRIRLDHKYPAEIYDAIRSLIAREKRKGWQCIQVLEGKRRHAGGRGPRAYRLVEEKMVDWAKTAFLLLELANFEKGPRRRWVEADEFASHMLTNCAWKDRKDLDQTIHYAWKYGYINKWPTKPYAYDTVRIADRTTSEAKFLELIAPFYERDLAASGKRLLVSYYKQTLKI